ncbi:hypothetical protein PIB30_070305 [Stylosanthes scabra]|uniref:Uncharacterized protein n=1 Tax=Stylosanthes scabra TaxID=79078 RepID=A0ABU6UQ57_9FABA|nr:hypothetical protein [Stylosanthes scabra]
MEEEIKEPKRENERLQRGKALALKCKIPNLPFINVHSVQRSVCTYRAAYAPRSGQLPLHESLLPMLSLAFSKYFSIPKVLKYASTHIKIDKPTNFNTYFYHEIQHKTSRKKWEDNWDNSQNKEEAALSPIPAEEEKKKKEPAAYMPKPPYPQRLKVENKNKAPKKEFKEEKGATNDSVKFQQIEKVPNMPYLQTIMGNNNKTYMITEGVYNMFVEPP